MNGLTPNCLDDFLFSNAADHYLLKLVLERKLPFPLNGKSGILLHGTWGTGKSTLAKLLPELVETAYSGTWGNTQQVGQMAAPEASCTQTELFRCGGGLSSPAITLKVATHNARLNIWHFSKHSHFVFDEVDRLTTGAQQPSTPMQQPCLKHKRPDTHKGSNPPLAYLLLGETNERTHTQLPG